MASTQQLPGALKDFKIGDRVMQKPESPMVFIVQTKVKKKDGTLVTRFLYYHRRQDFFFIHNISDTTVTIRTRERLLPDVYQGHSTFTLTMQDFFKQFVVVIAAPPLSDYSEIDPCTNHIRVQAAITPICPIHVLVAEPELYRGHVRLITGNVHVSWVSDEFFQIKFEVQKFKVGNDTTTLVSQKISLLNAYLFKSANPLDVVNERLQKAMAQLIEKQIKLSAATRELSKVVERHKVYLDEVRLANDTVLTLQKQLAQAEKVEREKQESENEAMQRELEKQKSHIAALEKKLRQREIKQQTSVDPDLEERGDEEAGGSARAAKRKREDEIDVKLEPAKVDDGKAAASARSEKFSGV